MNKPTAIPGVRLQPLSWWQIGQCAAIDAQVFPDSAWSEETFWSELARVAESRFYLVAVRDRDHPADDDTVVGYAGLACVPPEADVQTIALAPEVQGMGVGRALLTALIDESNRRGCTSLMLEVAADNTAAIGLYESVGFEALSRRRDYYAPGRDAVIMRRRERGES